MAYVLLVDELRERVSTERIIAALCGVKSEEWPEWDNAFREFNEGVNAPIFVKDDTDPRKRALMRALRLGP